MSGKCVRCRLPATPGCRLHTGEIQRIEGMDTLVLKWLPQTIKGDRFYSGPPKYECLKKRLLIHPLCWENLIWRRHVAGLNRRLREYTKYLGDAVSMYHEIDGCNSILGKMNVWQIRISERLHPMLQRLSIDIGKYEDEVERIERELRRESKPKHGIYPYYKFTPQEILKYWKHKDEEDNLGELNVPN